MIQKRKINNLSELKQAPSGGKTLETIIISLPLYKADIVNPFTESIANKKTERTIKHILDKSEKILKEPGCLFVYGSPVQLIKIYESLPESLRFRYWIAIDMLDLIEKKNDKHLKHNHIGLLMLLKGNGFPKLNTKDARVPYIACTTCGKNIKDWGGKKHLMNIKGAGISDVWRDFFRIIKTGRDPYRKEIKLNFVDSNNSSLVLNKEAIPEPVLDRLVSLVNGKTRDVLWLQIQKSLLPSLSGSKNVGPKPSIFVRKHPSKTNRVVLGDCIEVMESWIEDFPKGMFDLVFADPPYNLNKKYEVYNDGLADKEYVKWCDRWLELCARLTKSTGSILMLNIPKWALEHAKTLNKYAYLQNWIVWNALSTPKGKIMPAHYALLYYTKSPSDFSYDSNKFIDSPEYCLRAGCVKARKKIGKDKKVPISDIWWDIHRIKHKKERDNHPCQLPVALMDRIVELFSKEGDLVFDPFAGAGTTAISALKNNRRYLTIEIDPYYKNVTEKKLKELKDNGHIARKSVSNTVDSVYTKKWLELKVQEFAKRLNRKPSLNEFITQHSLELNEIEKLYNNPKDVLKAGRISLLNHNY